MTPADADADVFDDASLLAFAPTRILSVVFSALLLMVLGVAAIVATPFVVRVDVAVERLFAALQPAFFIECVFAILAAPVAALISLHISLPREIAARFISDAVIIPIAAAVVLILLVRARRRSTRSA